MTEIERLQMNANQANSDFVAIKGKIVEKGVEVAEGTRTAEYAGKVDDVYEAGRKSQYDEFWESIRNEQDWVYGFAGRRWNNVTFKPPFDIILGGNSQGVFYGIAYDGSFIELLNRQGIILDTSQATNLSQAFAYSMFTEIPKVDFSKAPNTYRAFYHCDWLITATIILTENNTYDSTWGYCSALENLTIEGTIGQSGINLQWSKKLSKASWISIIDALSSTATGKSITGSLESVQRAFETSAGAMDGDQSAEWLGRISYKANWTINLV